MKQEITLQDLIDGNYIYDFSMLIYKGVDIYISEPTLEQVDVIKLSTIKETKYGRLIVHTHISKDFAIQLKEKALDYLIEDFETSSKVAVLNRDKYGI